MINIGEYNELTVARLGEFGVYLTDGDGNEVLLPARYITDPLNIGDSIRVFIYTDSEDRLIATTETPKVKVGEFAILDVAATNRVGAFLSWGLMKDLLVPFSEQKVRLMPGMKALVYVYLDDASKRVVASAKIEKFIGNAYPEYKTHQQVRVLPYKATPIGYACIVDNMHNGMIYSNETYREIHIGEWIDGYVKKIRDDGKIDITLSDRAVCRTNNLSDAIMNALESGDGHIDLGDKSDPDEIKKLFHCSKKDYKKAIGHLFKEGYISISDTGITLLNRK